MTCHYLEPDRALPYQVFARDSSVMTPWGTIVTALKQGWRRGEYAAVIRFYQEAGIPIWRMVTAGALEGGDVIVVEPGVALIGSGEERTEIAAARQLAGWFEAEGWEARVEPIPGVFVHIDVLVAIVAPRLAAVCTEVVSTGLVRWFSDTGSRSSTSPPTTPFTSGSTRCRSATTGCSPAPGARSLNEQLAARGLELFTPELDMFTLGGGGAHCLGQALRREPAG